MNRKKKRRTVIMAYNYTPYQQSNNVLDYKRKQDTATGAYNHYANKGYSAGAGGLGSEVQTAQDRLNALYRNNNLSQQFKYSNQGQYNKALNDISNRKAFSYDLADDTLFQQAKEQYQTMGKTAMADTIGQASAMTGGYGNSYATTAGAQAYNAYLQELNNSIGDYYAMALSSYNAETDRLNSTFSALSSDRSTESAEWANNWNVYNQLYNQYYNQYSDMLSKDQSAWAQKGTNLYNSANLATSQYNTASSNDINIWNSQEGLKAEQASQIETERANRAQELYQNASLEETIRANQAQEEHNKNVLNFEKSKYDAEVAENNIPEKDTTNARNVMKKIQLMTVDLNSKEGKKEIESYLENAFNNHGIDAGELKFLLNHFGIE